MKNESVITISTTSTGKIKKFLKNDYGREHKSLERFDERRKATPSSTFSGGYTNNTQKFIRDGGLMLSDGLFILWRASRMRQEVLKLLASGETKGFYEG